MSGRRDTMRERTPAATEHWVDCQYAPRIVQTTSPTVQRLGHLHICPSRQPTTGPGPHRLTLLDLPYELRLDIYELLLLATDPIIVSSHRRQLRVKVEPPEHRIAYQRAPRPRPRVVTLTSKKPHVDILQTCKQVNHEATPLLYRGNDFIVGLRLGGRRVTRIEPADLAGFFLCSLRPTTLLHLSSLNFRGACQCDQWLSLPATAGYSVTGNELVRVCSDAWDYHQMAYLIISNALWNLEKGEWFYSSMTGFHSDACAKMPF
ncbi:hypothetical protein CH063_05339 [Colletotrichum higginsianum]|uniref:F-box domain-containing protein n=1 Tax=Colletotrichum higginsianum (strain IMI 349063) TaxID=759273 RepID=H1UYM7_COLHI|nr:hypothetical protein CH63R_12986 [Colletotrichum higginsianum IMI 349063]OBR03859.1 hypothetical protein CH63R_12986 [Colletotrichum higginsianum IMI 349063]CCF33078.1 hypothetical protein CH063_05339 [Colletotrichum higginsianum]